MLHQTTYKNMLSKLPSGQDALVAAYEAIEKTVHDVDAYVRVRYISCDVQLSFFIFSDLFLLYLWSSWCRLAVFNHRRL